MRVTSRLRPLLVALWLGYVAFLATVLLRPSGAQATGVVMRVAERLVALGVPAEISAPVRVEFLLNAAMFAPLTLLAALILPRHPWANWVVYTFVASAAVEVVQGFLLPLRSAQFVDVVANTLGGLVGSFAAVILVRTVHVIRGR